MSEQTSSTVVFAVIDTLAQLAQLADAQWHVADDQESYDAAKKQACRFAQRGDLVLIGRRPNRGAVVLRMGCRVGGEWRDMGVMHQRVAQALDAGLPLPARDAAMLVQAEVGAAPWVKWNATHDAILRIMHTLRVLAPTLSDRDFVAVAEAHNAALSA